MALASVVTMGISKGEPTKVDSEVLHMIRVICASTGETMTDWISDRLRPLALEDLKALGIKWPLSGLAEKKKSKNS